MIIFRVISITFILLFILISKSFAVWIWTPETNKWTNPKFAVKSTPAEQLNFALDFYNNKKYPEAIREFQKLLKHYPKAKEAPESQFYLGQTQETLGNFYEAFKSYQLVVDKYPFSDRSADVVKKQFDLGVKMLDGEGNKNKMIDALTGANYNVIDVFRAVIKNAPYDKLAPAAQYKIGLYLMENKLYQEARDEFEKLRNDYPESEWAKAAEYQIAMTDASRSVGSQYDQEITKTAVEGFQDYIEKNPEAELSTKAKGQITQLREKEAENNFVVAQFYEKQKNFSAAKIYYETIVNDYKDTSWSRKALEKIRQLGSKENEKKP